MSAHTRPFPAFLRGVAVCLGVIVLSPIAEIPAVSSPTAPPQAKNEPRRDRYGDPLPPGAVARLGTLRFRARREVRSLAFAPDGKTIAVASYGGLFRFDAVSGKRLQKLSIPENFVQQNILLAFSPDGKRLARRGGRSEGKQYKGVVFVWDMAGKGEPRTYDAERAIWIGWSSEGEPLAVCLEKDALCLRELASDRSRRFECKNLRRPELYRSVTCAYVPAGKTLAIADEKRQVHIWDTATGRQRCIVSFKNVFIRALALSPDGRILASLARDQNGATLQLWDAVNGAALRSLTTDQKNLHTLAFAPDGKTLVTSDWSNVCFWDVATGRERRRVRDWPILESSLAFSGDGKWLATATQHGSCFQVWDAASGKPRHESAGHRCAPHGTAFAPDGRRVATGGTLDGTIYIWDTESSKPLARIQHGQWVRDIAFSADGRSLFSTWTNDELWISDADSGDKRHILKLEDPDRPSTQQSAIAMHLSDDGRRLVAFSYYHPKNNGPGPRHQDTLITGWDTSTYKQLFRRRRPGMESWRALSPDGRVLAMCYPPLDLKGRDLAVIRGQPLEQRLRLEDAESGEPLLTLPMRTDPPSPLAFSPDGRLLATYTWQRKAGAKASTVQLWETATASAALTLPSATSRKAAFSPDGRLLALIAPAQDIIIYDLSQGRELRRFRGFDAEVTYLAFSPDGRRLVSGLDDSTLLIWDMGRYEKTANKVDAEGIAKAWADLASTDAPRAFRARWTLASAPEQALPLLRKHLPPAKAADPQRLHRLLTDLDSEQFAVREKAQEELEKLGDLAEPALRQTLVNKPSLEMRQRMQAVLQHLRGPVKQPELLQALRAVAVLEDIGTSEARRLLEELAKGASESRLTREAKASLRRLNLRKPSPSRHR